ncbi:MAG: hypothetical protein C5B44_04620 [Acidobacteria bacterium]|nr:MAG: hypothetical protein C5B44_04620 [Acidobacteriota bacterium]
MDDKEYEIEKSKLTLESRKIQFEYRKFIWGSVVAAIALAAIPPLFQLATAYLEKVRGDHQIEADQKNKESELKNKQEEFRQEYIKNFINNALNQDVELRIRFADYFAFVSPESVKSGWVGYRDALLARRKEIRDQIDKMENALRDARETAEIDRLARNLEWAYNEVGYVARDRSVAPNPRPPISASSWIDRNAVILEAEDLFDSASINPDRKRDQAERVQRIKERKTRYQAIENVTGIPWFVVGAVHWRDAGGNFSTHLNGDPLTGRTIHVPVGRPPSGDPPFTWEESTIDLLTSFGAGRNVGDWTLGSVLDASEAYNGFGYRRKGFTSPFIWGCTNIYKGGMFLRDHTFQNIESKACGVAAIIKMMFEAGDVNLPRSKSTGNDGRSNALSQENR